jgi:hypothetical protein
LRKYFLIASFQNESCEKVFNGVDCAQIGIFLLLCRTFPCKYVSIEYIFVIEKEWMVPVVKSAVAFNCGKKICYGGVFMFE